MHARVKRVPLRFFATRIKKLLKVYKHTRSSLDVNEKSEEREKERREKSSTFDLKKKCENPQRREIERTDRQTSKERKKEKKS